MKNEIGKNTLGKIRILAEFIESKHGISLARAISMNPVKMDRILAGEEEISFGVVNKIASYFFLPPELLLDDERELPDPETLEIDVDLLSVQRNDIENDIERMKQKHFISRNWKMIGYRKRLKLILSVLLISIPFIAYIFFCISEAAYERFDDMRKYEIGSDGLCYDIHDPVQKKYHDDLVSTSKENNADAYYVDVKVGTVLERIKNISSATSSYETRMQVYFKFDKDEFRNMFRHYTFNVLLDQVIDDYYVENPDEKRPVEAFDHKQ